MDPQRHSTIPEGVLTGVIGAVTMAVWYFIVDTAGGQPLPSALARPEGPHFGCQEPCRPGGPPDPCAPLGDGPL
jgi:hypothetical protein